MNEHASLALARRSTRVRWLLLIGFAAGAAACASVLGIEDLSTDPVGGTSGANGTSGTSVGAGGNNGTAGSAGVATGGSTAGGGTAGVGTGGAATGGAGTGGQTGIADASTDTGSDGRVVSDTGAPIDAASDVKLPPCAHDHGGPMVDFGSFCIDANEVTNDDYGAFLVAKTTAMGPGTEISGQPLACIWNQTYVPSAYWPPNATDGKLPVIYVDWCDAKAYCAWTGKRLCGRMAGGPVAPAKFADQLESQWMAACTSLGANPLYSYGSSYSADICNGGDRAVTGCYANGCMVTPVGSLPDCHGTGAAANVFDMSGNVWEWEDSCSSLVADGADPVAGPAGDVCRARGGSIYARGYQLRCDSDLFDPRSKTNDNIGIRCCSP